MRVRERVEFFEMDDELHLARGTTSKYLADAVRDDWDVEERNDESFSLKPKSRAAPSTRVLL